MDFFKHVLVLLAIGLLSATALVLLSPTDVDGGIADLALKFFFVGFKATLFSLGLKVFFGFLNFYDVFEKAGVSVAGGLKSIAVSIIILAWALIIVPF